MSIFNRETLAQLDEQQFVQLLQGINEMFAHKYPDAAFALQKPHTEPKKRNDEDEPPKKAAKKSKSLTQEENSSANYYQVLEKEMDTAERSDGYENLTTATYKKPVPNHKKSNKPTQNPTTSRQNSQNSNVTPNNQGNESHSFSVPPITVTDTKKWIQASKLIKINNINVAKSRQAANGVQVNPLTEEDYRKLRQVLESQKIQHYTYELRSEKKLKIVLRGINTDITDDEITEDLAERGYPITKITRMRGRFNQPIPLVLVEIAREYKSMYGLAECCGLDIKVEPLRTRTDIIQCHKCQLFGHPQKLCHVDFRCMKCGEEHSTHLCPKPRTTPPKCANCGGEHLSTWMRCPRNPNNPDKPKYVDAPLPKENPWEARREQKEAEKDKQNEQPKQKREPTSRTKNPNTDVDTELATILGKMLLNYHNTNATVQQKIDFLNQTEKLTKMFNR